MRNLLRVCVATVSLLAVAPATATAQKDVFVDAFIALHSALPGTYGDEGPQVTKEFERLTSAFAAWNRSAEASELALKNRSASPGEFALYYVDQQQLEAALEAMNRAIAAEPSRASLYLFQGQLFDAIGRTSDAHTAFARAREIDPDDPVAAYLVATRSPKDAAFDLQPIVTTLLAAGDRRHQLPPRPFADLTLVRDLSAKTPAFAPAAYAAAFSAFAARRYRDAVDQFRAAIARDPLLTDPAAQSATLLAGVAALRANNGTEAVRLLETAVKSAPESSESRRVLGIAYRAVGKLAESIAQFEIAVRLKHDDERARVALGTALAEAGRLEDAERELRDTIRTLPASGDARWALADLLDKQSRGLEAIPLLEDAAALPVVAGRAHLLWRIAEMAHSYQRDADHVIAVVSQMARLAPNEASAYKDLGLAYYRAGRDDEATIALQVMALLGLEDGETLGALGEVHFNAGRLDRAVSTLRRAVALDPARIQARYVLARTFQRLGRDQEANEQLAAFDKLRATMFEKQRLDFERVTRTSGQVAQ
ncbi:MAG TPA: tetratricopeptide repeat protein [Vicinamibacterales bacterium]|nr:tetratricopeptide repeat protein [Vicinamibacterales bacterium]